MFPEVVRPGTLSNTLRMQICIGNAIEILQFLQAGITVEPTELDVLSGAATLFRSQDGIGVTRMSSAVHDSSTEMVSAVRAALAPTTVQDLRSTLTGLADALDLIASSAEFAGDQESIDGVVSKLSAIRRELASRGAIATDEPIGRASA